MGPTTGILLNSVLIPKLLNNLLASCFLINFDFLLIRIVQFDDVIDFPLLVSEIFWFMFSVFFLHFRKKDNIV